MYCIGAVLTVLTGGSFLAALGIGFKAAAMAILHLRKYIG